MDNIFQIGDMATYLSIFIQVKKIFLLLFIFLYAVVFVVEVYILCRQWLHHILCHLNIVIVCFTTVSKEFSVKFEQMIINEV